MIQKHVSVLVPAGAVALSCLNGPFILFDKTNEFLTAIGKKPLFNVQFVGLNKEARIYDRAFTVTPDTSIHELHHTDLIIIPAVNGNMKDVIEANKDFLPFIVAMHNKGAEVASLCVGTFLLAATGLLEGKKCSTHWNAENEFRNMFPDICLVSDKIITDDDGIYSSGGANSFWNLLLYLLEKYTNREMAVMFSKYFEIELDRHSQSAFTMFNGQRTHKDDVIKRAQEFIEQNYQDKITIKQLTNMLALSRRNFERRFKKATSNTVVEYIQRVKMEAAKKDLEGGKKNINEVMYQVGYTDHKAFRTTFKKVTGLLPLAYRNKYYRQYQAE